MKTVIASSALALLLGAGIAQADVAPGMQQEEVSLFEQMDQNTDGIVSQSEFEQYSLGRQEKVQIFTVIDKDGDGTITVTEWRLYQESEVMQPRAAEEPAMEQPMEQPMSTEEDSPIVNEELQERAFGPGVENQQRRILEEKMSRGSEQQ